MDSYEQFQEKLKSCRQYLDRNVFLTLYYHEIRLAFRSFLQRAWIVSILFFGLLFTIGERNLESVGTLLVFFVFFGTIIALVISSSSISGEIGGIADSLLSKSVKRWEYLLSKFISHITVVLIVYFSVLFVMIGILWNFEFLPADLDYENLLLAVVLVGFGLVFFSSCGVMFSSIFSKTIFSLLASIIVWFLLIFLFVTTEWEFLYSPVEILHKFDVILDGSWDIEYWKLFLFYIGSPLVFFAGSLIFFYQKDL
jgi:ABC-type transport system involved in multi-copper enzyme maturation permease subunit